MKRIILLLTILSLSPGAFSKSATVKLLRGKVYLEKNGKKTLLKKGDKISENSHIISEAKSFARVVLPDNSTMNVGPKSSVTIESFRTKEDPSLIKLAQGMVRASIPEESKKNLKMVIKTKSAVMGIRGTKVVLTHNNESNSTAGITIDGVAELAAKEKPLLVKESGQIVDSVSFIASAPGDENSGRISKTRNENNLSQNRKNVPAGTVVTVSANGKIRDAVKISPIQFEALQRNTTFQQPKATHASKTAKIIPRGLSVKKASGKAESLDSTLGVSADNGPGNKKLGAPKFEMKKGAPLPGGYVDLNTGLYIPPAKGSTYNAELGVFVPNEAMGKVDPDTGAFLPPEGADFTINGEFVDSNTGEVIEDLPNVIELAEEGEIPELSVEEIVELEEDVFIPEEEPDILADNNLESPDTTFGNTRTLTNVNVNIKVNLQ